MSYELWTVSHLIIFLVRILCAIDMCFLFFSYVEPSLKAFETLWWVETNFKLRWISLILVAQFLWYTVKPFSEVSIFLSLRSYRYTTELLRSHWCALVLGPRICSRHMAKVIALCFGIKCGAIASHSIFMQGYHITSCSVAKRKAIVYIWEFPK